MKTSHLAFAAAALVLVSCAKDKEQKKEEPMRVSVGNIHFDESANAAERGALVAALEHLNENHLLNADSRLLNLLKVPSGDGRTVLSWLEERIQVVAGESFNTDRFETAGAFSFENPGVLPEDWRNRANQEKGSLVMANYGALAYLLGKEKGKLWVLNTSTRVGQLRFTSPRAGFLVVGEGLLKAVRNETHTSQRAFQLSTLLHEARHSDGNGQSAGFVHAKCPSGHNFAGVNACDQAANGPYTIDALTMKSLVDNCGSCSEKERNFMQGQVTDSFSRVLNTNTIWNDQPEGSR